MKRLYMEGLQTLFSKMLFVVTIMVVSSGGYAVPLWSPCTKITAVTDYRAYDGSIYLTVSPRIAGCSYRLRVKAGINHATDDLVQSSLALGTTALVSGKGVMFYYNNDTTVCPIRIISLGGYAGQCK